MNKIDSNPDANQCSACALCECHLRNRSQSHESSCQMKSDNIKQLHHSTYLFGLEDNESQIDIGVPIRTVTPLYKPKRKIS